MPKQKKAKFSAKRKTTLIDEPNWEVLQKAITEEEREDAFKKADDFVHFEVPVREHLHWLKKWIREESAWDLDPNIIELPDTYMVPFAKCGWIAIKLGFIPKKHFNSLTKNLKPFLLKSKELRENLNQDLPIHPSVLSRDSDDFLHIDKVKTWLEYWVSYVNENRKNIETADRERKIAFNTAETYVVNMRNYIRTGVWTDNRYGEKREGKVLVVCKALAYNSEGEVKRSKGTWYPDIQTVWDGKTIT